MSWNQLRKYLPGEVVDTAGVLCVIPIWPVFAEQIYRGVKRYEFRKVQPRAGVENFLIYETSPISLVTGYFTTSQVIEAKPMRLWEISLGYSGINKDDFFNYYAEKKKGVGIIIDYAKKFVFQVPLSVIGCKPPQSYVYI